MLETMRKRLRALAKLVPRVRRGVIRTDFEDKLGDLSLPELSGMPPGPNRSRFETQVRTYVRSHPDEPIVRKIASNEQVTAAELDELSALFIDSQFGTVEDIERVTAEYQGFGLFMRSMTGLSYEAAAVAVDQFRSGRTLTAQQDGYLELLIEVLAKNGSAAIGELYESPFTLRAPQGPEQLFTEADVDEIDAVLKAVRARAQPAGVAEG